MNRIALIQIVAFSAGLLAALVAVVMVDGPGDLLALAEPVFKKRELMVKESAYRCFKVTFEAVRESLANDDLPLRDACTRVVNAARENWPVFLERLKAAESGDSDEERVAHNLVGHIHEMERTPSLVKRVGLDAELQELITELRSHSPASASNDRPPRTK